MAERRATNKYYPPDWDPSKGSVNTYKKSHPLRDRAKKLDQGILVVRFEMPYNIWCNGCNNHIGRGVRFNAEKSKVGKYYTSPIYQFKMKCRLCDNFIILKTDPANFDYAVESGAKKQAETKADGEDADHVDISGQTVLERADGTRERLVDSMLKLERKLEDRLNSDANQPSLRDLREWRSRTKDNFSVNQVVRAQYRRKRKSLEQDKERDKRLLMRTSLKISLAEPSTSDTVKAKNIVSRFESERLQQLEQLKRTEMLQTSRYIPKLSSIRPHRDSTPRQGSPVKLKLEKM